MNDHNNFFILRKKGGNGNTAPTALLVTHLVGY